MVGPTLCRFVTQAFENRSFDIDINQTLLVLIPKTPHPELFSQFRPISSCNVAYKLVTKIIVNLL